MKPRPTLAGNKEAGYTIAMRIGPLALLLLALSAAVRAAEPRRVELEIKAPERTSVGVNATLPQAPVLAAPSLPEIPSGLTQPAALNPASQPDTVLSAAVGAAEVPLAADRGVEAQAAEGRARFDLALAGQGPRVSIDDLVSRTAARKLDGVFIQQEQEGSLIASDPRDSSGNFFQYYRPVELRPELMADVQKSLSGFEKIGYGLKRAFNFWDKKDGTKVWNAWPVSAKLAYLGKLEEAVSSEKGRDGAWKGKVSLILEKTAGAPSFLTRNPHMENPPAGYETVPGSRFLQPELVSDKDKPAATINEAIGRTKMLIAETGHAGTQYHVFIKAEPAVLRSQLASLQSALQLVNNVLFARAATESIQNIEHASLLPWHRGRSRRVAQLLAQAAADPHTPQADDLDSEKHSFVGLRYWGTEDGKLVVSFELRGAGVPWKQQKRVVREMETAPRPERDYAQMQRYLTFLSLYAEKLNAGRAPRLAEPALDMDWARADALVNARADELKIPRDAYYGVSDFAKRLSGAHDAPLGFLFAFAASDPQSPALRELIDSFMHQSARVRALDSADGALDGERRNIQYIYWSAYREWALGYEARERAKLDALFCALGS